MPGKELLPKQEFSSRENFFNKLNFTFNELNKLEEGWQQLNRSPLGRRKTLDFNRLRVRCISEISSSDQRLGRMEEALIYGLFDLFSFKHKIGYVDQNQKEILKQPRQGKIIGFLGPLGVGKTTTARTIAKDFRVRLAQIEPYEKNAAWRAQQKNAKDYDEYMLRSQIYFLLANLNADIRSDLNSRLSKKTQISDTSILTDILMWVEWYHETGKFDEKEYEVYKKIVNLFMPIVPRPDLLVVLNSDTAAHLKAGVDKRRKNDPKRAGEKFTQKELEIQMSITDHIAEELENDGVPILKMVVNPIDLWVNSKISYDIIYKLRSELGILGDFIKPKPKDVAEAIRNMLAETTGGQVVIVHSQSMFAGKTSVLCHLAEKVGRKKIIAFQPAAALRSPGQEAVIISRDGERIEAQLIKDNDLWSIVNAVKEGKYSPKKTPYVFIDEIQLFIKTESKKSRPSIEALEELRRLGFHVIVDGIDYTFQQEPFTFMFKLLQNVIDDKNWHSFELSTRCRDCGKIAHASRRLKSGKIADFHDKKYLAGDKEQYEPVCGDSCPSFANGPVGHSRMPLPKRS